MFYLNNIIHCNHNYNDWKNKILNKCRNYTIGGDAVSLDFNIAKAKRSCFIMIYWSKNDKRISTNQ